MAADIVLADCIVPIDHDYQATRIYGANICIDCKNACGDCEWSETNPETGKIRFQPVPGWTATPVLLAYRHGQEATTYRITACPKFDPIEGAKKYKVQIAKTKHRTTKRPVVSIDGKGNEKRYSSISEAASATGANQERIGKCCISGKGKTGGYKWRYA